MRIAVSGAHGTGKTSLVESLADALPGYVMYEEPYYRLEAEGHVFAGLPSSRDFELQLDRSIQSILSSGRDCVFDRCPADFLAYLQSQKNPDGSDIDRFLPQAREAMASIDRVVYLPIEYPDRILIPKSEGWELRRRVDERLQEILLDDSMGFNCKAIEITGTLKERLELVLKRLK